MKNMNRLLLAALLLASPLASAQTVTLWRNQDPARGSSYREETRIEVAGMNINIGAAKPEADGKGQFQFIDTVERTYTGTSKQEASVLASTMEGSLFILGKELEEMKGGDLLGKKLLGKRDGGAWKFDFKDVKPTPAEQKALEEFGKRSDFLTWWPMLYGAQPRRVGEAWNADTRATEKDSKNPSPIELVISFKLLDVAEHLGERCANLSVSGYVKVPFGPKNVGKLKINIDGNIWRSVRDFYDVETAIHGEINLTGAPANDPNLPPNATLDVTAPYTLKRLIKPVKR
ncbi:hypothetical protein BH11VER1_BH11VER1_28880 [soil metagenome]